MNFILSYFFGVSDSIIRNWGAVVGRIYIMAGILFMSGVIGCGFFVNDYFNETHQKIQEIPLALKDIDVYDEKTNHLLQHASRQMSRSIDLNEDVVMGIFAVVFVMSVCCITIGLLYLKSYQLIRET